MKQRDYADRDNWLSLFYELGIEYPAGSDAGRVMGAMQALWRHFAGSARQRRGLSS